MSDFPYKFGKLPAVRPHGLSELSVYAKGKLPLPPASVDVPDASYPVLGNDRVGDCTLAGVGHLIAAWDTEVKEDDPVPDTEQTLSTYFSLTGGADSGLNEASVLATWKTKGLFGRQIAGYAPVNPRNLVELHQAIAFYGGAYLGIACPESAQQQFAASQPWTYVPRSPVAGGHCIVALGYTQTSLLCATWGGIAEVTYGFFAHYLEEAWAIVGSPYVELGHGPTLDLEALEDDLNTLAA